MGSAMQFKLSKGACTKSHGVQIMCTCIWTISFLRATQRSNTQLIYWLLSMALANGVTTSASKCELRVLSITFFKPHALLECYPEITRTSFLSTVTSFPAWLTFTVHSSPTAQKSKHLSHTLYEKLKFTFPEVAQQAFTFIEDYHQESTHRTPRLLTTYISDK